MTDDLDTLLSAPLPAIDDASFSRRVTAHVAAAQQRRMFVDLAAIVAATGVFLAVVPLAAINNAIETVTLNLGSSLPVAVAIAALVLTFTLARYVTD